MEIRFKNLTVTEKHIFNFFLVAMILTFIGQLYLKFIANVEVNFKPIILAVSGLLLWCFLSKEDKNDDE